MILAALRSRLLANTDVAALVGTRIYTLQADQKAAHPLVILQEISGVPEYSSDGEAGIAQSRVQVSNWSTTHAQARSLANKIRLSLSGFRGDIGTSPAFKVHAIFIDNAHDTTDQTPGVDQHYYYGVQSDYIIWHAQSVPTFTT